MQYQTLDTEGLDLNLLKLLETFLLKNFPVGRIKEKKRFQRGIIIPSYFTNKDKIHYPLKPGKENDVLNRMLFKVLKKVFNLPGEEISNAIYRYLYVPKTKR